MEPISLILAALVAGATAASQDVAGNVIKDSYQGLKSLIQRKFKKEDALGKAMVEAKPEEIKQTEGLLKNKMAQVGIDKDEEIIKLAEKLLKDLKGSENESSTSQPKFSGTFTAEKQMIQQADKIENKDISF